MKISAMGSAVPRMAVGNDVLATFLDTNDEWIVSRTGISERRVLSDDTLPELAHRAAQDALERAGITPEALDMVVCSTALTEYVTPAFACIVAGMIGAKCPAYDINAACAGFVYGLDLCEAYLQSGRYRNILFICAENLSRMADWHDRSTCVLFGDGVGAAVLQPGDALRALELSCEPNDDILYAKSYPGNSPFVREPKKMEYLTMKGQDVFRMAVGHCVAGTRRMVEQAKLKLEDVKYFIIHQANLRIIKSISGKLDLPMERFPHNIERYGNTSSASVPILLDEMQRENRLERGDLLVISAFGAGFSTGTCVLEWQI